MVSEANLNFKNYNEISYYETYKKYIDLYGPEDFQTQIEVWTDRENENREYIIINSEIIYLDTLEKLNK